MPSTMQQTQGNASLEEFIVADSNGEEENRREVSATLDKNDSLNDHFTNRTITRLNFETVVIEKNLLELI
ncbi:hypothetical protein KIN20_019992 [Parelaphostrongylus tenuis]|uniref:Uncharacterized protein n=1 Tax=Parelaphostrongylus tenuis TaxID=148309 RepID=A0AAD5MLU9_PARTN|nr:hypothetical protein KIN20_019992 [Parelaphostrongylus tenuis]